MSLAPAALPAPPGEAPPDAGAGPPAAPFRGRAAARIMVVGIVLLALTIAGPVWRPGLSAAAERVATLAALVFLLAAPGLAMRMGRRAFVVSAAVVAVLYAASATAALGLEVPVLPVQEGDLFVVALLLSFAIFALAGFNLVFVLEEMVYDAHRLMHPRGRAWLAAPLGLCLLLAAGLPLWRAHGGPDLPALWAASVGGTALLSAWWLVRAFGAWRGSRAILRELHLFVVSVLTATLLADGISYLKEAAEFVPALVAYLVMVGTWVYVSYTTLQRTHFLLRARDPLPWVSLLLAASFAIAAHLQMLFRLQGVIAVEDLVGQRVGWMVAGVWVGIGFYSVRALWRGLHLVRADRDAPGPARSAAGKAAKVAKGVLATERLAADATYRLYQELDKLLPGTPRPPQRRP
jgi:hypothetical protein